MISRVAESCFWLHRYVERAENMARLLRVNRSFLLDVSLPELHRWRPAVVVSGEEDRFPELFSEKAADDAEVVQEYLTWDTRCHVSICSSLYWARENARTIRDVVSLEMWESVNDVWHWLKGGQGRRLFSKDRDAFYQRVKSSVAQFQGVCYTTMLHDEPFDFMRLGMLLERAGQTARIVDVKYHLLGPTPLEHAETAVESAQWMALLRSCSAEETFFKQHYAGLLGPDVAAFLIREERFPRSVYHCLNRAHRFLLRIKSGTGGHGERSLELLEALVESLKKKTISDILKRGLHQELTEVIDTSAVVCAAIHEDYFDPSFAERAARSREVRATHE